jgi:hypothetical protein
MKKAAAGHEVELSVSRGLISAVVLCILLGVLGKIAVIEYSFLKDKRAALWAYDMTMRATQQGIGGPNY